MYFPPSITELPAGPAEPETASRAAGATELPVQDDLMPRQRDVLELLAQGSSNKEIARALKLGEGTVKVHMVALFRSLGVSSRSAAAASGSRLSGLGKAN